MAENTQAYNSLWQLRSDSWCRLEEAADRLRQPTTTGDFKDTYIRTCHDLLAKLARVELYWAYPGPEEFAKAQRLFTSGSYDKFFRAVSVINRTLITESYRTGEGEQVDVEEQALPADPRTFRQPAVTKERPYFEVLVVEEMTEAAGTGAARRGTRAGADPTTSSSTRSWWCPVATTR